jgi:mannose-6-phosphate isomerase-like protein (cupin superfamily)
MNMKVEKYYHRGEGYNPFLIRERWQVAQLNHVVNHGFEDLLDMERHQSTDEVFILFKGTAVILTAEMNEGETTFEYVKLDCGVTYNVPAGVWHNIAMSDDAQIILVENSNTHLYDVEHRTLSEEQLSTITQQLLLLVGEER